MRSSVGDSMSCPQFTSVAGASLAMSVDSSVAMVERVRQSGERARHFSLRRCGGELESDDGQAAIDTVVRAERAGRRIAHACARWIPATLAHRVREVRGWTIPIDAA